MSLDTTVDPCENFEAFACGKWSEAHPTEKLSTYTWFHKVHNKMHQQLRDILHFTPSQNLLLPLKNAKFLYNSCIENESDFYYEHFNSTKEMRQLKSLLRRFGLIYDELTWRNGTSKSLIKKLANVKRILDFDIFFYSIVQPFLLDNSYNVIIMYPATADDLLTKNAENVSHIYDEVLNILKQGKSEKKASTRKSTKKNLGPTKTQDDEKVLDVLKRSFIEIISNGTYLSGHYTFKDEKRLDKLIDVMFDIIETWDYETELRMIANSDNNKIHVLTVGELQEQTNSYQRKWFEYNKKEFNLAKTTKIWTEFYTELLKDVVEKEDVPKIPLLIVDIEQLYAFSIIYEELDHNALELYLWLQVIAGAKSYTSGKIRRLFAELDSSPFTGTREGTTIYCANKAENLMPFAVTRMFIERESNADVNTSLIFNNFIHIRDAYGKMINDAEWLDSSSRVSIIRKIYRIRWMIGYPDWIREDKVLLEYYRNVKLTSDDLLLNWMKMKYFNLNGQLESLNYLNDEEEAAWPAVSPLSVNAFYSMHHNQITIPYGILSFPFFWLGLEAMNFGALGMIIGHEISHGFDPNGKLFDHKGDYKNTWTKTADEQYSNKTSCFIRHYDEYYLPEAERYLNGEKTLNENVADSCGLAASFHAYKQWLQDNGEEPLLPGFIEFTHEQLFYLSFANIWCGRFTKVYYEDSENDVHAPNLIRILGVLRNSAEFSEAWNCQAQSYMNPKKKCSIW